MPCAPGPGFSFLFFTVIASPPQKGEAISSITFHLIYRHREYSAGVGSDQSLPQQQYIALIHFPMAIGVLQFHHIVIGTYIAGLSLKGTLPA